MKKLLLFFISSLYFFNISSMGCTCGCQYDRDVEAYEIEIAYYEVKRESFKRLSLHDSFNNLDKPIKVEDKEIKYKDEKVATFWLIEYSSRLIGVKFDKDLFEELIKNGANKDLIIQKYKHNPPKSLLISAISHNNLEAVEILLENGADPNLLFPLMCFAQNRGWLNFKILELLLKHGADPNLIDEDSNGFWYCSPLFYLINQGSCVRYDRVESKGSQDETYIKTLEINRDKSIIKTIRLLLEYGANPNLVVIKKHEDESGCNFITPYGYAKQNNLEELVAIFDAYNNQDQLETLK